MSPTPKESQPEPYNSYFDIPIETQTQYTSPPRIDPTQRAPNLRPNPLDFREPNPLLERWLRGLEVFDDGLHSPTVPGRASTPPPQDHHMLMRRWKAKALCEHKTRLKEWQEQVQRSIIALAGGNDEDGLLLSNLNILRSIYEEEEFRALKRSVSEVEAILQDCNYDGIGLFTVERCREQWTKLRQLEFHTEKMFPLEIQEARNFCLTSWNHIELLSTENRPPEGYDCPRCSQWMGWGWKCCSCKFVFCGTCLGSFILLSRYYTWLNGKAEDIWFRP
jgi:hypothetical protein